MAHIPTLYPRNNGRTVAKGLLLNILGFWVRRTTKSSGDLPELAPHQPSGRSETTSSGFLEICQLWRFSASCAFWVCAQPVVSSVNNVGTCFGCLVMTLEFFGGGTRQGGGCRSTIKPEGAWPRRHPDVDKGSHLAASLENPQILIFKERFP